MTGPLEQPHLIGFVPILNTPSSGMKNGLNQKHVGNRITHGLIGHVHLGVNSIKQIQTWHWNKLLQLNCFKIGLQITDYFNSPLFKWQWSTI